MGKHGWLVYMVLLIVFWGVWGAFSALPATDYGYPSEMIYIVWALTMLIPCAFIVKGHRIDTRVAAIVYGLLIGLTGAGGQLILFRSLTIGPAYLIFPVVATSPAITVVLAFLLLRERVGRLGWLGIVCALVAIVLFSIQENTQGAFAAHSWLLLAVIVSVCWGLQALFIKYIANMGVSDASTFFYMTVAGIVLIPVAYWMMPRTGIHFPWQAPALTAGIQLLNAVGALFLVMALSRGKAIVVTPCSNALAPVLTVILSLVAYQTLPSEFSLAGIVLAIAGSAAMIYADIRSSTVAGAG